jgi:hypothetical protein
LNNDIEGRSGHGFRHVNRLRGPGVPPRLCLRHGGGEKARNKLQQVLVSKSGSNRPPLPSPVSAFGEKQSTLVEDIGHGLVGYEITAKQIGAFDEHIFDHTWIGEEQCVFERPYTLYEGHPVDIGRGRKGLDVIARIVEWTSSTNRRFERHEIRIVKHQGAFSIIENE